MGIMAKYFGCFYIHFFMVIIMYIYVYIVINDYLCVFIPIKEFSFSVDVCVFIPMVLFMVKK